MRKALSVGLFSCATVIVISGSTVSAEVPNILLSDNTINLAATVTLPAARELDPVQAQRAASSAEKVREVKATQKPKPVVHTVQSGESLSKIARRHSTTWPRLYDKNHNIKHPDVIKVGDRIVIPDKQEELKRRELPAPEPVAVTTRKEGRPAPRLDRRSAVPRQTATTQDMYRSTTVRGSSSGNTYTAGYCTWYVKNRRPDLPNNLGNADTWVSRAAAQGMATGSQARVGAVGQRGMHVVYVERVNADGTVTISEMNHKGLYVQTTRTLPANYFQYIY